MTNYFEEDIYQTPEGLRSTGDKIFLNTRWYFVAKCFKFLLCKRRIALNGGFENDVWQKSSYEFIKLIESCGGKFSFSGLDNIRDLKEPVVYVSNHMSTLETFVFPCIMLMAGDVSFVVKRSLTTNYIFGPIMRATDPVVVNRKNPKEDLQQVLKKGKEYLQNGTSVVVFPQSTRSVKFDKSLFNSLGVKLAKSAGVKVVPVAIKTNFWENGKILKELGPIKRDNTIHMKFGEPISIEKNGKAEQEAIVDFICANLESFGGEVIR